ncbi:hypothetical protein HQQ94_06610 [Shewanella sp. VB17]|uniref:hypothetical protein n=1 Tax=Shewanella sp. VB17 TaxID=2739432 RepID=UPI00156309AF|nr:hypothetical protein [Shewanella sp. VB17]NRD72915.1 hypothetical protein [Shewanella sp. VB17]
MNVYLNQSDETHKVWERSKNDTVETLTINVVTGALIGSESKENYITLSGNIWDDDLAGNPNDHLCNLNSGVKIYQKDVGKRLTNVFTGGDRQCEYLEVTKFTLAE